MYICITDIYCTEMLFFLVLDLIIWNIFWWIKINYIFVRVILYYLSLIKKSIYAYTKLYEDRRGTSATMETDLYKIIPCFADLFNWLVYLTFIAIQLSVYLMNLLMRYKLMSVINHIYWRGSKRIKTMNLK